MQLHELTAHSAKKTARRVGRGGKRGKMSGRGHKGQTARAGGRPRTEMRDIIKRLPKLRGHGVNRAATVNEERVRAVPINVGTLEALFAKGDTVSPQTLMAKGAVSAVRKQAPLVKILGTGDLSKALTVKGCQISASAKAKIEAAGGSVE